MHALAWHETLEHFVDFGWVSFLFSLLSLSCLSSPSSPLISSLLPFTPHFLFLFAFALLPCHTYLPYPLPAFFWDSLGSVAWHSFFALRLCSSLLLGGPGNSKRHGILHAYISQLSAAAATFCGYLCMTPCWGCRHWVYLHAFAFYYIPAVLHLIFPCIIPCRAVTYLVSFYLPMDMTWL